MDDRLVVFNAGSLGPPLRAALDSFALGEHIQIEQENAGSLASARKLTDLHRIPDVLGVADYEVFPHVLMPKWVHWYLAFARNRMVIAYTKKSHFASEITTNNWWDVLSRPGVLVGRSDPNLDPNGYRALIVMRLATSFYHQPDLSERLLKNSTIHVVRPMEMDLLGLLQAGELDYIWSYESVARATGLAYVNLPDSIDLGTPADSSVYAGAGVSVLGRTPNDTIVLHGEPILYALSIPVDAPHPALAARFVAYLMSDAGRRVMRREQLDALDSPVLVGTGVPVAVSDAAHGPVAGRPVP
ncbi:MAG TPA: extracellular solute-binding protein [Gemmatimonadaceae bacterium]|jgi:molybdate/tungstate transport system substrate-binding protein